ncbi:hypothetical protein F4556_005004 [Kitasatospora gansuensis]|uniref:Uncharacterized protein n=1 Tax=Kitasatospora gansuensis TaxID=258050 RepID=A0A7W7WK93_9ACTN|nr:hypothetical protein [Kitasatospora gansuensis]
MGRLDFDGYALSIRPQRRAASFRPGLGAHRLTADWPRPMAWHACHEVH